MALNLIIDELVKNKISLHLKNGELKLTGPKEKISSEVIEKIRTNKEALIAYLQEAETKDLRKSDISPEDAVEKECSTSSRPPEPLDFSVFYFGNANEEGQDDKDIYRLFIDGAKHADRNGYAAVWVPERHFNRFGGLYPSPSVLGAALATITENINIRAGSVVLPLQDPIRIAEEWSVVDNLSGGRVGIASASGWHPNDFVFYPDKYKGRHTIMYENIATIQKLWRGETINLKDGNGVLKDTKIYPSPIQKELPLWITSSGNVETFISAGKLGLNMLTHLLSETVEELEVKITAYRKAYREGGFDERNSKVTVMLHTFIGDELETTYAKVRKPFISYLKSSLGLIKNRIISMGFDIDSENFTEEDIEEMFEFSFHRYISSASLIGTKKICKKMLYRLSNIGVDEVACLIDFGVDYDSTMNSLSRLTELKEIYNQEARIYK